MFPAEHDSAVCCPVPVQLGLLTFVKVVDPGLATQSATESTVAPPAGKVTVSRRCVAVAPLIPDSLWNLVTEMALSPAVEMTWGATSSVTHDAALPLTVGVVQMLPLAARLAAANASAAARTASAATPPRASNFRCFRMISPLPLP